MNNQVLIDREQLENWLAAFQCGPTTQHKAMAEIEGALQSPAPEGGELIVLATKSHGAWDGLETLNDLPDGSELMTIAQHRAIVAGLAGNGWIACSDRMPESGCTVLAYYRNICGNGRRIRAQHVKAWTILAEEPADPDTECVEYSEQEDAYYLLEGWYECVDNLDEYYRVQVDQGPVTHWQPLPPSPKEGGL